AHETVRLAVAGQRAVSGCRLASRACPTQPGCPAPCVGATAERRYLGHIRCAPTPGRTLGGFADRFAWGTERGVRTDPSALTPATSRFLMTSTMRSTICSAPWVGQER